MKKKAKKSAARRAPKKVSPVPAGYSTVTPYLVCRDAGKALAFYSKAFGAKETMRMPGPDGKIMHAEMKIGDSMIMLAEEMLEYGNKSPLALGGSPVGVFLYLKDVDKAFAQATAAGCSVSMPLADQFWGDRYGKVNDPFGHQWSLATHKEDLTGREIAKRQEAFFAQMSKAASA